MSTDRIGYRITEDIPRVSSELLNGIAEYTAPELCDACVIATAMDHGIKPRVTQKKIVGQAVTLRLTLGDSLMVTKAMSLCRPGDILVIDAHGSCDNAVWGDRRSLAAVALGLGGAVIDGAVRDIEENEKLGFPLYARAVCCAGSSKGANGEINVPVACGGVTVNPGDIIVGDRNGVVVVPIAFVGQVTERARENRKKSDRLGEEMRTSGKVIPDSVAEKLKRLGY